MFSDEIIAFGGILYIQHCVKGISGSENGGLTWEDAQEIITCNKGIVSNLWRNHGMITPQTAAKVLNDKNLDRHLHNYATYQDETPFISLACGAVVRDRYDLFNRATWRNDSYPAIERALSFATNDWNHPGALFFLWVITSNNITTRLAAVAEPVRDLNIYRRWSPNQTEGEITAKIHIPANQIKKIEWWDGTHSTKRRQHILRNVNYFKPKLISNIRDFF